MDQGSSLTNVQVFQNIWIVKDLKKALRAGTKAVKTLKEDFVVEKIAGGYNILAADEMGLPAEELGHMLPHPTISYNDYVDYEYVTAWRKEMVKAKIPNWSWEIE